MKRATILLTVLLFLFVCRAMAQEDSMNGPWEEPLARHTRHQETADASTTPAFLVGLFRTYVSPIDGSSCTMYPSCSQYSLGSFEEHGFLLGWIMTWDRLYRCGRDELAMSPWVIVQGKHKCYDPLENNDFWWNHGN